MKQRVVVGIVIALLVRWRCRSQLNRARPKCAAGSSIRRARVLPGVTVTVRNQETGMFRETVSGADGSFIASGIVPGTYQVVAELQGFKKFDRRDLVLEVGKTATHRRDAGGRRASARR